MKRIVPLLLLAAASGAAERINQEGRILGTQPTVTAPTQFDTAAADAVVSAMQIMPRDSAWNEDVSALPLLGNSAAMIATIRNDVAVANRQRVVVFQEMNYVLVPDSQPKIDIGFFNYADESDDLDPAHPTWGLWPIPSILPIETWPTGTASLTLPQWQQDVNNTGGDRHSITVMPGAGWIWETWLTRLTTGTPAWQASNGAKFSLTANTQRPAGWTSGDAAGLPMFPALVRYDEAERGMVEHAMRIVVKNSRKAYIYPASHQAGSTTSVDTPAMGQRLRLKSSFAVPSNWSKEEKAIAAGLKKYGALVADNGSFFSISICPDDRWPAGCFSHLSTGAGSGFCDIDNFEVVQSTGATGGPRSSGAPTANAGPDKTVTITAGATLAGSASGTGLTTRWYVYPYTTPPGTVTFGSPGVLATTVSFSAVGTYTLMLEASDGVHTPAFDAVIVTVTGGSGTTSGSTTSGSTTTGTTSSGSTTSGTTGSTTSGTSAGTTSSSSGSSSSGGGTSAAPVGGGSGQSACGLGSIVGVAVAFALVAVRRGRASGV
jgi:hypothetical protein